MPEKRARPVRLNAAPRQTARPPRAGTGGGGGERPRRSRGPEKDNAPYWFAVVLLGLVIVVVVACFDVPFLRGFFFKSEDTSESALEGPLPSKVPARVEENAEATRLERKIAAERKREAAEKSAAAAAAAAEPKPRAPSPVVLPPPGEETTAPIARPLPRSPGAGPARALPLDDNKLDTERIAAYQVALERSHFSCGFIDGNQGMRTQRMLRAFQQSRGLPITGFLDPATRAAIGEPGEPFLTYTVTANDTGSVMPAPGSWRAKAHAKRLGYNTIWELLAEKFHCTRAYLKALNPGVTQPVAGTEVIGPKVFPAAPYPHAASLRVVLGDTSIEALDSGGHIIAFFPCSIAKDKNKRPNGKLVVKSVVPDPDYTFDPALFADAAKAEGLTHKMVLPPGPRNPVGTAWVGLSLPGYGIHGTPEPENISRTQSHGCFRLANWNAEKVLKMVHVGTPVDVVP